MNAKMKLAKGDLVRVIAGKDRHTGTHRGEGKIIGIDRKNRRVKVDGLNLVKKTRKPTQEGEQGSIIEVEAFLDVSNVMIICPHCGPTRIGWRGMKKGKERICRKCEKAL